MRLRTFTARTMTEAMGLVRQELGLSEPAAATPPRNARTLMRCSVILAGCPTEKQDAA